MALTTDLLRHVFENARRRCECRMACPGHQGRCNAPLRWEEYGRTWRVLSTDGMAQDSDRPEDYFVLCSDPLHGGCYEAWTEGVEKVVEQRVASCGCSGRQK